MKFTFTKHNVGIISALVLVILLSQSRFFDFLTEMALGRMVLLALICYISYTNKITGLLVVLFIILAYNYNDANVVHSYNYYEGFTDASGVTDVSGNISDLSGNMMDMSGNLHTQVLNAIKNKISGTSTSSTSGGGIEGFCMTDKETSILRGKQSNAVPVFNKSRVQSDNVNPMDSDVFTSFYSMFQ